MANGDKSEMDMTEAELKALALKLRRFFEWNRCYSPEDLAQDTILRGLKRLAEGQINYGENPHSYFLGIARNILREERKKPRAETELDENCGDPPFQLNAVHWRILLRECLDQLSHGDRDLIARYILEGPENAAQQSGLTQNAVRIRVSRIRSKIAVYLRGSVDVG